MNKEAKGESRIKARMPVVILNSLVRVILRAFWFGIGLLDTI